METSWQPAEYLACLLDLARIRFINLLTFPPSRWLKLEPCHDVLGHP